MAESQVALRAYLRPPVLFALIDELRQDGYLIGLDQYCVVQDLVAHLLWLGLPLEPDQLRSHLAPILCKSPLELQEFAARFDRWITPWLGETGPAQRFQRQSAQAAVEEAQKTSGSWIWVTIVLACLLVALILFIGRLR